MDSVGETSGVADAGDVREAGAAPDDVRRRASFNSLHSFLERWCAFIAGAVIIVGFFLPWLHGAGAFAHRSMSGFQFARLVRNSEITASSSSSLAELRLAAVVLYLVPALAVNGVVVEELTARGMIRARPGGWCLILSAAGMIAIHAFLLAMLFTPVGGLSEAFAAPRVYMIVSAIGAMVIGWRGWRRLHVAVHN